MVRHRRPGLGRPVRGSSRRKPSGAATAIAFAEAQLGKPYCWGGQGPGCFDCSGLVFTAYAAAGIHLARTTYQWQQDGPQIPLADIEPGDLLFSAGSDGTPSNPGHVVMYLGGGQVIQAPQTGENVQTSPLDLASYRRRYPARRPRRPGMRRTPRRREVPQDMKHQLSQPADPPDVQPHGRPDGLEHRRRDDHCPDPRHRPH